MAKLGIQIKTLQQSRNATKEKLCLSCPKQHGFIRVPAAMVINMQGFYILNLINEGLFIYIKRGTDNGKEKEDRKAEGNTGADNRDGNR